MNFLVGLFKKASKGDNFRNEDAPLKYNDQIAQLNSTGDQQYNKLTSDKLRKLGKTQAQNPDTIQGNTTLPGTR